MTKMERFYESLTGREVEDQNGEYGYLVTVGDLIDNGGKQEFFRKVRKHKDGSFSVSSHVFYGLEYDRSDRIWWANDWCDMCGGGADNLKRSTVVFIGFTF